MYSEIIGLSSSWEVSVLTQIEILSVIAEATATLWLSPLVRPLCPFSPMSGQDGRDHNSQLICCCCSLLATRYENLRLSKAHLFSPATGLGNSFTFGPFRATSRTQADGPNTTLPKSPIPIPSTADHCLTSGMRCQLFSCDTTVHDRLSQSA